MNAVGERGTITFWYRANTAWSSGTARQLLDASSSTGNAFSLQITNTGLLQLTMSDSSGLNAAIPRRRAWPPASPRTPGRTSASRGTSTRARSRCT
jgi:hypothetical protein